MPIDGAEPMPPHTVAKTAATLGLLLAALPVNLAVTAVALARGALVPQPRPSAAEPLTVLLSGGKMTKALALARAFHRAGHRVVLVESGRYRLTGHRFSRAVDRFHVVPEAKGQDYVDAVVAVARREGADVFVPVSSPAASRWDSAVKEAIEPFCASVHVGVDMVEQLDDKEAFSRLAASLGLAVPDAHRITDPQQVIDFDFAASGRTYILKSIPYDPVRRLDLTRLPAATPQQTAAFARSLPMSPDAPWILQEFIEGQEYCTHSTVRDGEVQLHCCCASSAFQINYAMVDKPEIEAWVRAFVGPLGLTGQISLDFIQAADGRVYAIECNPRTHSAITMFYDHPDVARAYLDDDQPVIEPLASSRPTYWLYHEVWRALSRPRDLPARWRVVRRGKDAIFDWADPLPFLLVHHLSIPWLLVDNLRRRKGWIRVDFNIGKLVEPAGD